MLASPIGPVEATLRRQSDTFKDPGLDYSTCRRVEDGTPTHIRSLFRPDHTYYPSHTPWPSDEKSAEYPEGYETFDFNTAKSVAEIARLNSQVLSLPPKLIPELPYVPKILQGGANKKQRTVLRIPTRKTRAPHPSLDGADGIEADHAISDSLIHGTSFTSCTACPPHKKGDKLFGRRGKALYNGTSPGDKDDASVPLSSGCAHDMKATDILVHSVHSCLSSGIHSSPPGPSIRPIVSHSSLQLKCRPRSLETAESKTSAHRHALLKPSVIAGQAIDAGLPVEPFLVGMPDKLTNSRTSEVYNNALAGHHHEHSKLTPVEALSSLLELPQSTLTTASMQYPKASVQNATKLIIDERDSPIAKEVIYSPEGCANPAPDLLIEAALRAEEYLKISSPSSKGSLAESEGIINGTARNANRLCSDTSAAKLEAVNEAVPDNNPSSDRPDPQDFHGIEDFVQKVKKASEATKPKGRKIIPGKQSSRRVPFKHTTIPPRMSSLEKSIPISRKTFKNVLNRENTRGQLVSKDSGREQSMSSKTSSMINAQIVKRSQTPGKSVDENGLVESCAIDFGSKQLHELLYDDGPYIVRLTEIPPRKHRLPRTTSPCSASQSGTLIMAEKRPNELNLRVSQTFIRTIDDLEKLMSEALQIARQVAEKQDAGKQQGILHDHTVPHGIVKQSTHNMARHNSPFRSRVANMLSNQESAHESAFSESSDSLSRYNDGKNEQSVYVQRESSSENFPERCHTDDYANTIKLQRTNNDERTHNVRQPYEEDVPTRIKTKRQPRAILNKREVTEFIRVFHQPPIQSRHSSLTLRKAVDNNDAHVVTASAVEFSPKLSSMEVISLRSKKSSSHHTLSTSQATGSEVEFRNPPEFRKHVGSIAADTSDRIHELKNFNEGEDQLPKRHISGRRLQEKIQYLKHDRFSHLNLRHRSHISLRDHKGFSLSRSHRRQPIARDWSPGRKRFAATVACISTALIGILIGIYAGEVPSIQYYIADFYHYAILGNVCFFITLAVTTFLFWPLPLLHGRKPYILAALTIAMPLLFPQAIAVSIQRSPYVATWRVALILPRTVMGAALGFANINFMATLTDLFGASLQSSNPHQEVVDEFDVRRHGGGLGVWLGIWTWCYIGSIGVGFLIGAVVINTLSPDWGFYVSIIIIAAVLLLNVVTPEVRRSPYRRSVAEVRNGKDISRRLARGEVMMHRLQTGPKWWGEEFHHGVLLSLDMLRQPGFLVMSMYVSWMYGQVVLVIVLLGSLMSKYYHFTSPAVGATTMAIPLGALLAVPFQKASLFSRARRRPQRTDSMTFNRKVTFSSHLVRRAIFTIVLPFAGLAYTLSSAGPPTPFILPVLFSGLIGFLSNLAIAECNGILMETFDTSDLQPGMTGRPRGSSGERTKHTRTNYSSFPRVSSAFAIIQALGFLIGAAATGVGGVAERHIGQQAATGVMAGILLVLTIGVLGVLYRFKEVQIIPTHNETDIATWEKERKMSFLRQEEAVRQGAPDDPTPELEEPWRPVIIGNPSGKTRRMSILELGHLSRWSEIRQKNKLIDEMSYEARHPNLATLEDVRKEIRDRNLGSLRRGASQRSRRSQLSQGSEEPYAESEDMEERAKST